MKAFHVAGVIHQCTRCYSLRNVAEEPAACPTCQSVLHESVTETRPLSLCDITSDFAPTVVENAAKHAGTLQEPAQA